ncbi:hypothetical protein HDU79_003072 [Rhizoclosmatium sp. JEL0117]|nr:hypothetical protein HDU79_003072 [Rhizoclosmatium sp. JEL0117]
MSAPSYTLILIDNELLASSNITTFIVGLATIMVSGAIACFLLKFGDVLGASHIAILVTQAPFSLFDVLTNRKRRRVPRGGHTVNWVFCVAMMVVGLSIQPLILAMHQLLLNMLPTRVSTSYPTSSSKIPVIVRGDSYGRPFPVTGIPLVLDHPLHKGFPSAGAAAVRGDLISLNTRIIKYSELQPFIANSTLRLLIGWVPYYTTQPPTVKESPQSSPWYVISMYHPLPPGILGIQGSRYSIRLSYGNIPRMEQTFSNWISHKI